MTHTSTEQPEALMRLADNYAEACFDQGLNQRTTDDKPETEREKLEKAIRRMHTRISELEAQLSATHPTQHGLEQFIEQTGDVHFQRCRVGSKEGEIRWDVEFGHYGAEVRGKTLRDAITKALAAQAKHGEAQQ